MSLISFSYHFQQCLTVSDIYYHYRGNQGLNYTNLPDALQQAVLSVVDPACAQEPVESNMFNKPTTGQGTYLVTSVTFLVVAYPSLCLDVHWTDALKGSRCEEYPFVFCSMGVRIWLCVSHLHHFQHRWSTHARHVQKILPKNSTVSGGHGSRHSRCHRAAGAYSWGQNQSEFIAIVIIVTSPIATLAWD